MDTSLLIRKGDSGTVYDTETQWGVVCSGFPFKVYSETKSLPQNDWADEDGLDVYYPSRLRIKAYSLDVELACKSTSGNLATMVKSFLDYLTGQSTSGTSLTIYDTHTKIGRKGCYVTGIDNDMYVKQRLNGNGVEEVATFKVTFNVCDPLTQVTLSI